MVKQNQLAKACINCGLKKPLSAFLQISGPQGTTYGNVCATCRGSSLNKTVAIPQGETDETSSSGSELTIDSKVKVQMEVDKRQQAQKRQDLNEKEAKKLKEITDEKSERTELKKEAEEKHRTEFLEPKKTKSFLDFQSKKQINTAPIRAAQEKLGGEKHSLEQQSIAKEEQQREEIIKNEQETNAIDLTNPFADAYLASKPKFQSTQFQQYRAWLGPGAAINVYERQFLAKTAGTQDPATNKTPSTQKDKDPLIDYINETWEPNSPKPSGSRRR